MKNITRLKVQAVKYEANEERGQQWAEIWCDYGFLDGGTFYAYPIPSTMESLLYFKFENGMHPASPGTMLGRCDTCRVWRLRISGPCDVPECPGTIEPYASYNRFRNLIDANPERDMFPAVEQFLCNDPSDYAQRFPLLTDMEAVEALVDGTP